MSEASASIAALVVTFHPDAGFRERLERLLEQVSRVLIVDNGSSDEELASLAGMAGVTLLRNAANLGIAAALNQGMRALADDGIEWVLTLDQDSGIAPGFIAAMRFETAENDASIVALIGANRQDSGMISAHHRWLRAKRRFPFFERVGAEQVTPEGVTLVITSGTLTNVAVWRRLGPFREDFFIDQVDFEYCLRARAAGYLVRVSPGAILRHQVGNKVQRRAAGVMLSPTHHAPLRRYYQMRNSVAMMRVYGRRYPHWLAYQLCALAEIAGGLLIFESGKMRKLRACLLGFWDGLGGRMGATARRI